MLLSGRSKNCKSCRRISCSNCRRSLWESVWKVRREPFKSSNRKLYLCNDVHSPTHNKVENKTARRHGDEHGGEEVATVRHCLASERENIHHLGNQDGLAGEYGRWLHEMVSDKAQKTKHWYEENSPAPTQDAATATYHHLSSGVYLISRTMTEIKPTCL